MKFTRQFATVVLVVAVIVAAAVLWSHASGTGNAGPGGPPEQVVKRIGEIKSGRVQAVGPDTGFHLGNTQNLIRTCEIEAALAAFVITISALRLRRRRLSRRQRPDV